MENLPIVRVSTYCQPAGDVQADTSLLPIAETFNHIITEYDSKYIEAVLCRKEIYSVCKTTETISCQTALLPQSDMRRYFLLFGQFLGHYEFNRSTLFRKLCIVICVKPKELDYTKLSFYLTNMCFDSTQIYN